MLDFCAILDEYGINDSSSFEEIRRIADLEEFYDSSTVAEIYNYILCNIKNPDILIGVIRLSDTHKSPELLSSLLDILLLKRNGIDDPESLINIRAACAKAISGYKDPSTVGALLYCLNNKGENYKIRLACADALGHIGNRYAVKPLIDVVKDEDEKSVYVQESAATALGLLGDTSAIDPLVSVMESKHGLWGKFSFLKERIVEALGRLNIKSVKVLNVFKQSLMDSSPIVRINTIEALMNSEYEEAETLIRSALKDKDTEVQRNALIALYNMTGSDILEEVISLPGYSDFLKNEAQALADEIEEEDE